MLRQSSVFALALISGSAIAGPLANTVNGLLGAGGPTATPLTAPLGSALGGPLSVADTLTAPVLNNAPLPGLVPSKGLIPVPAGTLPIGATVLNDGANANSGYDDVVELAGTDVITSGNEPGDTGGPTESGPVELNDAVLILPGTQPETLGTPYLLSQDPGNGNGAIDVGVFDGDNTAAASQTMGIGAAVGSGSDTGTGAIGIGVGNDERTGNGSQVGIAVLSDARNGTSGNNDGSGMLGISALNQGDTLTICGMGTCGGIADAQDAAGNMIVTPANPLINAAVLAGDNQANGGGLISAAVLSGDNSGNGGTIALGVLSGDNVGQGTVVGAGVVTGDNSATGPIAAGVLTGDNSVVTNEGTPGSGLLAVGVITGDNSVRGSDLSNTTASDAPFLAATVLGGDNSGADSRAVNVNAVTGGGTPVAGPPPGVTPGSNPDDNDETAQNTDESQLCAELAKDNRGQVKGKLRERAHCQKVKAPKA